MANKASKFHLGNAYRERNSFFEFKKLLIRELRAAKRDPRVVIGRIISTLIIMTVCAVVFLGQGNQLSGTYNLGSHFGSFVFPMFTSCFGVMIPTVLVISEAKPIFVRERALNTYGSLPYVAAKLIPEFFVNFTVACVTVLLLYWSVQWDGDFMYIVLVFFLLLESCTSWAYLLAMAIPAVGPAVGLVALVLVPQLLFMGTFVRIATLPIWLQWISYICNTTYALRLVSLNEFQSGKCISNPICAQWAGLKNGNIVYGSNEWWYIFVLIVGFFFMLRAFAFMIIRKKINAAKRFGGF